MIVVCLIPAQVHGQWTDLDRYQDDCSYHLQEKGFHRLDMDIGSSLPLLSLQPHRLLPSHQLSFSVVIRETANLRQKVAWWQGTTSAKT
jgi:hypothetical protein